MAEGNTDADDSTDTDRPAEWVATTRSGWGRAFGEYEAVSKALVNTSNIPDSRSEGVEIWAFRVRGFRDVGPSYIDAEEVLRETHRALTAKDAQQVKDHAERLELLTEDALVNADDLRVETDD
jgi:hypothetical protein